QSAHSGEIGDDDHRHSKDCGKRLDEDDSTIGRQRSVDSRYDHTTEKEDLGLKGDLRLTGKDSPQKSRGKKSIIEALIFRERSRLLGEIFRHAKRFSHTRRLPEKHLDDEKPEVEEGDETGK